MAPTDLVIVIPGIMGSALAHDGLEVWAPRPAALVQAIKTLGRSVAGLELPDDLGDDHPGDGVIATRLLPSLHTVPMLWSPINGYESLMARLRDVLRAAPKTSECPNNPIAFPYDWRLSVRYSARQLKRVAESALERWQVSSPERRDAKIIFVCHSMGGLVARWFIAKEGGAEVTRKLITLGTPYRGSLKALAALTSHPPTVLGMFGDEIQSLISSFPSIYQLLPSYACIDNAGRLEFLAGQGALPLPTAKLIDSRQFYYQLEEAEIADVGSVARRHAIVGTKQATIASAVLGKDHIDFCMDLAGSDIGGDGTVSAASGPRGVSLDDNSLRRVVDKHGNLHCNRGALDEIEGVITSQPVIVKAGVSRAAISVDMADLVSTNDAFVAVVNVDDAPYSVTLTLRDERGQVWEHVNKVVRSGQLVYSTAPLPPGGYTLTVAATSDPNTVAVTSPFLVWEA